MPLTYEVLRYKDINNRTDRTGTVTPKHGFWDLAVKCKWPIMSVRRLSDRFIFRVGVLTQYGKIDQLVRFRTTLRAHIKGKVYRLDKLQRFIFYNPDINQNIIRDTGYIYTITEDWRIINFDAKKKDYPDGRAYFAVQDHAKEFIALHRPHLSAFDLFNGQIELSADQKRKILTLSITVSQGNG